MVRQLPLGISDFKKVIEGDYAYVDKSLFIQELFDKGGEVFLIPRMRRFGKTLNLSMLRYFFEKGKEPTGYLFESLKIWEIEKYRALQGQFPVIFLTLKDVKHETWEKTYKSLRSFIAHEFDRHREILEDDILTPKEKDLYQKILYEENDQELTERSLYYLTDWLYRKHKKKVILLIDEYDTPAHAAFVGGFYNPCIIFLRNWLSLGLKDNLALERGVLTGILRIAKESIFSGLNNVHTFTILNQDFQDKFGLTESETKELLVEYQFEDTFDEMKKWYNGYQIGKTGEIYNPWSVLSAISHQGALAPYWVNTSGNELIKQLLTQGGEELKSQLEPLLKGETIKKTLREGVIFETLKNDTHAVWNLLLFTGYLTLHNTPYFKDGLQCELKIPNKEVRFLYEDIIRSWFSESINQNNFNLLLKSLTEGDVKTFAEIFKDLLRSTMSVYDFPSDEPEMVYHAFVLGLLVSLKDDYTVRSNRESGYGRYDVMLIPNKKDKLGIIFEFKKVRSSSQQSLDEAAQEALVQIENKHYSDELKSQGIKRILLLGLAFRGKEVWIQDKLLP